MAISLKTDRPGLAIVDQARIRKNWTATASAWYCAANVSLSTLKRFRERKAIQKDAFIAICNAVGIEDWQQVVAGANGPGAQIKRRYRQSKRLIAEEVLSNLSTLDARVEFIAQAFEEGSVDAIALDKKLNKTLGKAADGPLPVLDSDSETPTLLTDVKTTKPSLQLVANVSIIQITMEV